MKSVSDVFKDLLKDPKERVSQSYTLLKLAQDWDKVVGPSLTQYCRPLMFKNRVLTIEASNSAALQDLHFIKKDILSKVNHYMKVKWAYQVHLVVNRSERQDFLKK